MSFSRVFCDLGRITTLCLLLMLTVVALGQSVRAGRTGCELTVSERSGILSIRQTNKRALYGSEVLRVI
jgi:hypothetical protein